MSSATQTDRNAYRGNVLKNLMTEDGRDYFAIQRSINRALDITPGAVSHWVNGKSGMQHATELALAYMFNVHRDIFYAPGDAPQTRTFGSQNPNVVQTFSAHRNRILAMAFMHKVPRSEEQEWMEAHGIDTAFMKSIGGFNEHPLGIGGSDAPRRLAEFVLAGPRQTPRDTIKPNASQLDTHEHVEAAEPNAIKLFLHQAEKFRENNGLEWFLDDRGRLRARKVTTVEF